MKKKVFILISAIVIVLLALQVVGKLAVPPPPPSPGGDDGGSDDDGSGDSGDDQDDGSDDTDDGSDDGNDDTTDDQDDPDPTVEVYATRSITDTKVYLSIGGSGNEKYVIEETLPQGVSAAAITNGGAYDAATGKITWQLTDLSLTEVSYFYQGSGDVSGTISDGGDTSDDITGDSALILTQDGVDADDDTTDDSDDGSDDTSDDFADDPTPDPNVGLAIQTPPPVVQQPAPLPQVKLDPNSAFNDDFEDSGTGLPTKLSQDQEEKFLKPKQDDASSGFSGLIGTIVVLLVIAIIAGMVSHLFMVHRHHRTKSTKPPQKPHSHHQMVYLLSYYISTNMKHGYNFQQLYPMMKAQGYNDDMIKMAYQLATTKK